MGFSEGRRLAQGTKSLGGGFHPQAEGDPGLVTCSKPGEQSSGEGGPQHLTLPYIPLPSQLRGRARPLPGFTNQRLERRPWRRGLWSAAN